MKRFFKTLALTVVLVTTVMLLPLTVSADGDFNINHGVLNKYTGSDTDVIIPDDVTYINQWAFLNCKTVTSVAT